MARRPCQHGNWLRQKLPRQQPTRGGQTGRAAGGRGGCLAAASATPLGSPPPAAAAWQGAQQNFVAKHALEAAAPIPLPAPAAAGLAKLQLRPYRHVHRLAAHPGDGYCGGQRPRRRLHAHGVPLHSQAASARMTGCSRLQLMDSAVMAASLLCNALSRWAACVSACVAWEGRSPLERCLGPSSAITEHKSLCGSARDLSRSPTGRCLAGRPGREPCQPPAASDR